MSVLKGEGRVPILFGSTSIAVGPRTFTGYLARPDLSGEWPTIVVSASAWGVTSNVKDVCRRLARQGLAVIAPDLYAGQAPKRSTPVEEAEQAAERRDPERIHRTLSGVVSFVRNPSGFWSSAEYGFGVLGLGRGGAAAVRAANATRAAALALVSAPLAVVAGSLAGYTGAVQALNGRDDETAAEEAVAAVRDAAPQAEVVLYGGVSGDFLDDYLPGFDHEVAKDAVERLAEFFEKHLPAAPE